VSTVPSPARVRTVARRRAASCVLALATTAALAGCGANLDPQTYAERNNADSSNAAVGQIALRNVLVRAPRGDAVHEAGGNARVTATLTNSGAEEDRLVEATTSAAETVVVRSGEDGDSVVVPRGGSTTVTLELQGLTRDLRPAEYIEVTFRFAQNGEQSVLVPVATTGRTDRPVYTGERFEGGEEPALQAPAGGDHGEGEGEGGHGESEGGDAQAGSEDGGAGDSGEESVEGEHGDQEQATR
jgi:copper(I)-binding protein